MQKSKFRSCLQMLSVLLLTAFVSVSCIKEDLSECSKPGFSLQVKAFDADNQELASEYVKDITLYIFDKNKLFLDTCEVFLQELVMLDYPGHDSLTVWRQLLSHLLKKEINCLWQVLPTTCSMAL